MKLEDCQENFKVTLLERPPKKSCSTSILQMISLKIENLMSLGLAKLQNHPRTRATGGAKF